MRRSFGVPTGGSRAIERIVKGVRETGNHGFVGPFPAADTQIGRIVQFLLISVTSAFISILVLKVVFPDIFAGRKEQ